MRFEYENIDTIIKYIIFNVGGKMKKAEELSYMIRKTTYIDILMMTIILIAFFTSNNKYILFFLLGYILAVINFYINTYTINYVFLGKNINRTYLVSLSYFFRIILATIIGALLFKHNKFNVVAYVLGYNAHYISILIYSLQNKDERM
ncbi:ATP synthase subunit I [Clostridium sp. MB40-C1]|uniref:ATP synthase subunit I n=1 Tax=Clostridium sp. MB40-C1 TaxID=3070996 RepID=UPI0027E1C572|nr:ATP synthase subunit I [Clostridium sp. MB40-C1]WMJ79676.1 ATP synthase subunit I [Clostridium sp. MB40-C1]